VSIEPATLVAFTLLNMSLALVLGLVSIASGTAVNLLTALAGARARSFLPAREHLYCRFQQAAGALLIALGLRLAFERAR